MLLFCSVAGVIIVAVVVLFRCRCDPLVLVPCYYCYCYFLEVDFACTSVAQAVVQSSPLVCSSLVGEFAASFLFVSPYLGCLTVGAGCPLLIEPTPFVDDNSYGIVIVGDDSDEEDENKGWGGDKRV
ncbi:hypothetical protein Q3G72_028979 [Acer saccharum]|nr:hypothetical protein Q3G72_028979 [Acer saccharum]